MANLSDIELNKVCRTCLLNSENMKSLFEISSTSVQISFAEMLMKSTQLTYFKNDGFPAQICHNCIAQLNTSYTFQLKCLNSETIIRKKTETNILTTPKSEATATSVNPNVNVTIKMEPARDPMNDCFNNIEQIYVPGKPLNTLVSITEMQTDLSQELDEIKLDVNTETSDSKEEMNKSSDIPSQSTESDNKISHARRKTFYSCRICDKSYCSKQNLTIHLRKHTGEKPYMCTICNSSFNKNEHLMRHIRSHTGEKPFLCTVCSSGFNRKDNLFIHMRKHSGEKPYTCTVCNYRFSTKTSLTTHMRKHSVPKSNLCTGCNIRLE